jgi:hypothetical protein
MAFTITRPLSTQKQEAITAVNTLAGDKITALYPLYKQLNVARTVDAQVMYDWIDSIRLLSNTANDGIVLAETVSEIRVLESQFATQLNLL